VWHGAETITFFALFCNITNNLTSRKCSYNVTSFMFVRPRSEKYGCYFCD